MKILSTPVADEIEKASLTKCLVYDFYLPIAISTPFGSMNVIRITSQGAVLNFFTPEIAPEPLATRGDAAVYYSWNIKREAIKTSAKFQNDQLAIVASNVSGDWGDMLDAVDWEGVNVVIRSVPTSIAAPTSLDCTILFIGKVDKSSGDLQKLEFLCSNGLSDFNYVIPAENQHENCRFQFTDDWCTKLRYSLENHMPGTVGAASTTTIVKSADLSQDSGNSSGFGTDLVDARGTGDIVASSDLAAYTAKSIVFVSVVIGSKPRAGGPIFGYCFRFTDGSTIGPNSKFQIAASVLPSGLAASTDYWVSTHTYSGYYAVTASLGGASIFPTTAGTAVTLTTNQTFNGYQIRAQNGGYWQLPNSNDWGTLMSGYWQIPDAQAGLTNPLLKPYVTIDFGSAVRPKLWRLMSVGGLGRDSLVKLVQLFSDSSSGFGSATFEGYFRMPPRGDELFEMRVPFASSNRYWRFCIRNRWSETFQKPLLKEVQAYVDGRHWWKDGQIIFDAATATAALQGLSRRILASYSGQVIVPSLPVAPSAGDTFIIRRGCGGQFNDCASHKNTENFGGFESMPFETVVR